MTSAAISASATPFDVAPAATGSEREHLLRRSLALLRSGLQPIGEGAT